MMSSLLLEANELRARLAALDASMFVVELSTRGVILNANQNFLTAFGYQLEEIRGRQHAIFVLPAVAESESYREFWRQLTRGHFQRGEYERIAKGGRHVWIQATYNPVLGRDGRPYKIVKFATDVTHEVERAINYTGQIEALHRSQTVIEFDMDGTILFANRNFLDLFGYELNEIIGRHHRLFVDPCERDSDEYARFWKALCLGNHQTGEFRRLRKDGAYVYIQASYNPIVGRDGRPVKIVKFATDVTSQVQAHIAQALLQAALKRDLTSVADATTSVARQSSSAADRAKAVLSDVGNASKSTDELRAAADSLGVDIASACSMSICAIDEVETTKKVIESLSERATNIGNVSSVIRGIANQTKLLALNAAIEAAKAGETGHGFAIVAQEVKALAAQTSRATEQITTQILAVQTATDSAVEAIRSIHGTISRLNDISSIVTDSVAEQQRVIGLISNYMLKASDSASSICGSMDSIAKTTKDLDKSTQQLEEAARSIA